MTVSLRGSQGFPDRCKPYHDHDASQTATQAFASERASERARLALSVLEIADSLVDCRRKLLTLAKRVQQEIVSCEIRNALVRLCAFMRIYVYLYGCHAHIPYVCMRVDARANTSGYWYSHCFGILNKSQNRKDFRD